MQIKVTVSVSARRVTPKQLVALVVKHKITSEYFDKIATITVDIQCYVITLHIFNYLNYLTCLNRKKGRF